MLQDEAIEKNEKGDSEEDEKNGTGEKDESKQGDLPGDEENTEGQSEVSDKEDEELQLRKGWKRSNSEDW